MFIHQLLNGRKVHKRLGSSANYHQRVAGYTTQSYMAHDILIFIDCGVDLFRSDFGCSSLQGNCNSNFVVNGSYILDCLWDA